MGVIIKESFNQTAIRILISFIGAIATIFIYPLNLELYGLMQYILNTAALFMPFIVLGLGHASMRFYPYVHKDKISKLSYFYFLVKIFAFNVVLFLGLFYVLRGSIVSLSRNPSPYYEYYLWYICVGAILFSTIEMLVKYLANYKIVAIPVAFQTLYKVFIPIVFALIYFQYISVESGVQVLFGILSLSILGLIGISIQKLNKQEQTKTAIGEAEKSFEKKAFFSYYFWAFASSAGSLIAFRIDGYMVPALTTFELNGDYSMAMFITTVITIPISAVVSIAHPMLSEAWKENNLSAIKNIYLKGSENLMFIGSAMLLAVFLLLDFLPLFFEYLASVEFLDGYKSIDRLNREWQELKYIKFLVLILGVSRLFDMASSVNGVIIQHSKWYRHNTIYIMIMVVINVVLNYVLITRYSITGAAIATTISLIIFNVMKTILIHVKINIQPFTGKMIVFVLSLSVMICSIFCLQWLIGESWAFMANKILTILFLAIWMFYFQFAEDTKNSLISLKEKWF